MCDATGPIESPFGGLALDIRAAPIFWAGLPTGPWLITRSYLSR